MYNTTVEPELAVKLIYICDPLAGNLKKPYKREDDVGREQKQR